MVGNVFSPENMQQYIVLISLCTPRLLVFFQVAPFMGGTIVSGMLRTGIAFTLVPFLFAVLYNDIALFPEYSGTVKLFWSIGLIAKEILLGFVFAYLASLFFWAMQSAGQLIDNQRGASMAQGSDPLSSEQASPLASMFFQTVVYLFYSTGVFLILIELLLTSYAVWSPVRFFPYIQDPSLPVFFSKLLGQFMVLVLLVASPMVIVCLLTDVGLGLINRFAQQLNVFSLSMAVKSLAVSVLMVLYYGIIVQYSKDSFRDVIDFMQHVLQWNSGA